MEEKYQSKYVQIGLNVIYYRKKGKMTQFQLAEYADVNRSTISAIERGSVGLSLDMIFKLSEALGVEPVDLLDLKTDADVRTVNK